MLTFAALPEFHITYRHCKDPVSAGYRYRYELFLLPVKYLPKELTLSN
jgi:hypothetical protein